MSYISRNNIVEKQQVRRKLDTVGDGSGTTDMSVDGSSVNVIYKLAPPAGETYMITSWRLFISDQKGFAMDGWGAELALTNGLLPRLKKDSVTTNLLDAGAKTLASVASISSKFDIHTEGNGLDICVSLWDFAASGQPVRLVGDNGDELQVLVQDNLTGITEQSILAQGYIL